MIAEPPFEECARRVIEALQTNPPLSRLDLAQLTALSSTQTSRTLSKLRTAGVVGRSAPGAGRAADAVRFELTGLPLQKTTPRARVKPQAPSTKWEKASFDGLLMAWHIALPPRMTWPLPRQDDDC